MPGRWTVAVESSPELQALLQNETHAGMLSRTLPPLSPQQKKEQRPASLTESESYTMESFSKTKTQRILDHRNFVARIVSFILSATSRHYSSNSSLTLHAQISVLG